MNSSDKLRILLDTTYILPVMGVKVKGVDEILELLMTLRHSGLAEFYYTPFNLLEALGVISRRKYEDEIVATGLTLLEEWFKLAHPTTEGYMKALKLRNAGFKDLIDLLLYTTAVTNDLLLLTRDTQLIAFLEGIGEDTSVLMPEERFISKYRHLKV